MCYIELTKSNIFGVYAQGLKETEANIYDGCGKNKNCVGAPLGCIQTMNCRAIVALMPWNDKYHFEMLAHDSQYVAFGLSDDNKMVKMFKCKTIKFLEMVEVQVYIVCLYSSRICIIFYSYIRRPVEHI